MRLADYVIDTRGFDWPRLLRNWAWQVSGRWTVWFMNRFGDLFLHQEGPVYRLSLDDGSFTILADSREDFAHKLDLDDNAADWLLTPLVDRLAAAGQQPGPGECYGFVRLPVLGGDYTVENITIRSITFQYDALGPIFEKLKDIPDGTTVCFQSAE